MTPSDHEDTASPARFLRRFVVYALDDPRGEVEDAVLHSLEALRPHAERMVVITGAVDARGMQRLDAIVDGIIVRPGVGRGLWAYRAAWRALAEEIFAYDEVVFTGNGWFGPSPSFDDLFARMDGADADVWGLSDWRIFRLVDHIAIMSDEWALNSEWLAVRRAALDSPAFSRLWRRLPATDGVDRPRQWEAMLAHDLVNDGRTVVAAFPGAAVGSDDAAILSPRALLEAGNPVVLREVFTAYPLVVDQYAAGGRRVVADMAARGYPVALLLRDLARSVAPRSLNANLGLLRILSSSGSLTAGRDHVRLLVILQASDGAGLEDMLPRLDHLPEAKRVVVTVVDEAQRAAVLGAWRRLRPGDPEPELRLAPDHAGPDTSSVFAACEDLLDPALCDLVVALHAGTVPAEFRNVSRYVRRQQVESLLDSAVYVRRLLDLFHDEPGLGLVLPVTPHIGTDVFGDGWSGSRDVATGLAARAGIRVPLDWFSPLAPYTGMWIARPEAISRMTRFAWDDLDEPATATAVRLLSAAAGEDGFHTRTVTTTEHSSLTHQAMEYTIDQMSVTMHGYPNHYITLLHRLGPIGAAHGRDLVRMYLRSRRPRVLLTAKRGLAVARRARSRARSVIRGIRGDRDDA